MARQNPNRLLVEGKEDERIIPHFMGRFIAWGNTAASWPVEIISYDGVEDLLAPGNIEVALKTSGLVALGVIVDADDNLEQRWQSIRARVLGEMPQIPADLPAGGLVYDSPDGRRFGAWVMPDNVSPGMIETFLRLCVEDEAADLWTLVKAHCKEAKDGHAAPYKDAHLDKAHIHAWLAIQDPPGLQLHTAVLASVLNPNGPHAESFVNWFCRLYGLTKIAASPE